MKILNVDKDISLGVCIIIKLFTTNHSQMIDFSETMHNVIKLCTFFVDNSALTMLPTENLIKSLIFGW